MTVEDQEALWRLVRLNIHWPEGDEERALDKINRTADRPTPSLTRSDLQFAIERWPIDRMYATLTAGQRGESAQRPPLSEDLPVVFFRGVGFEGIAAGVHRVGKWYREDADNEREVIIVTAPGSVTP
jgi:hypothetical protein